MPDTADRYNGDDEFSSFGDLLELVTVQPAWMADAACREHPELEWVPKKGYSVHKHRQVCAGCLVRSECLAEALSYGRQLEGVWGGTSNEQRRRMSRRPI